VIFFIFLLFLLLLLLLLLVAGCCNFLAVGQECLGTTAFQTGHSGSNPQISHF